MKQEICCVYDSAAKAYVSPIFVPNKGLAIRSFMDEANRADPQNTLHQHPEDFNLHYLGSWDNETGEFTPDTEQPILMRGRDAKKE